MPTTGSYRIWTADAEGKALDPPPRPDPTAPQAAEVKHFPDPHKSAAVDIYYGIDPKAPQPPPKGQAELHTEIEKVLSAVRRLYLPEGGSPEPKFRRYYVRIFRLAQLGLEGADASPDVARTALNKVTTDLIDDEAGRIKNGHMAALGSTAIALSAPFLLLYCLLTLLPSEIIEPWLRKLGVVRLTAANFMLLWLGCFLGVWLSYAIRTATVTLVDLTTTDNDRLLPSMRLLFAGLLTMVLGFLFVLGVVEIKLGTFAITHIAENAALAFLVGILCGISEAALPAVASRRAAAFLGDIK